MAAPTPLLVFPSTTSHKKEPLLKTLEVFSRLGMRDVDLNLHHFIELGESIDSVRRTLADYGMEIRMASGGWCDFYHSPPQIATTFESVDRQVSLTRALGADRLRLFYGRLKLPEYSPGARAVIADNMRRLSDRYPDMLFAFENHNGASLRPEVCREILETVDRPNVRMNFDPINFEHAGVNSNEALETLQPLIAHVHLKGMLDDGYCEFGEGKVDLLPVVRTLIAGGYQGAFTVEYEGSLDRTLRLYKGFETACEAVRELTRASAAAGGSSAH